MERQLPKALKSSPTMWKTICPRTVHWTETERPERKGGKKQRAKGRVGGCTRLLLCTDTMWDVSSSNILNMMTRTHPANLISPTKQSCSSADKLFLFLQPLTTHKIKKKPASCLSLISPSTRLFCLASFWLCPWSVPGSRNVVVFSCCPFLS